MKIKVEIGRTYNTGNYTSLKLAVALEDDSQTFTDLYETAKRCLTSMEDDQGVQR